MANVVPAILLTGSLTLLAVAISPAARHWFVLPVAACGILIGVDTVAWARGRLSMFDPVGVVGVFGFHFFFLAPLLHVLLNQWMQYVTPPTDWRPYLGRMALLNLCGLALYRIVVSTRGRARAGRRDRAPLKTRWQLAPATFSRLSFTAIGIAAVTEAYALVSVGGLGGFESVVTGSTRLAGFGWVLTIGESLPLLCLLRWIVRAGEKVQARHTVVLVMIAFAVTQFLLTGLRGSRGNLVYALLIGVGWLHLKIRPLSRRTLGVLAVGGLVFMYVYGFYKVDGFAGLAKATSSSGRAQLEQSSGRSVSSLLLEDLGRADVQAYELYKYALPGSDYQPGRGRSYVGDAALLVPSALIGQRPPSKLRYGTDLLYGQGTYEQGRYHASNIYGLGGEIILNFGYWWVPAGYLVLGFAVRRAARFVRSIPGDDMRIIFAPMAAVLCLLLLTSDLDNVLYTAIQFGLMVTLVVVGGSRLVPTSPTPGSSQTGRRRRR